MKFPPPVSIEGEPFQMLVSDLSYSDYLGRLAIGKVVNGSAASKENLVCMHKDGKHCPAEGLKASDIQRHRT